MALAALFFSNWTGTAPPPTRPESNVPNAGHGLPNHSIDSRVARAIGEGPKVRPGADPLTVYELWWREYLRSNPELEISSIEAVLKIHANSGYEDVSRSSLVRALLDADSEKWLSAVKLLWGKDGWQTQVGNGIVDYLIRSDKSEWAFVIESEPEMVRSSLLSYSSKFHQTDDLFVAADLFEMLGGGTSADYMQIVRMAVADVDSAAASEWYRATLGAEGTSRSPELNSALIGSFFEQDSKNAAAFLQETGMQIDPGIASVIGVAIAKQSPQMDMTWLEEFPAGAASEVVSAATKQMCSMDPRAASQFVNKLPSEELQASGASAVVKYLRDKGAIDEAKNWEAAYLKDRRD